MQSSLRFSVLAALVAGVFAACNDVGDNGTLPPPSQDATSGSEDSNPPVSDAPSEASGDDGASYEAWSPPDANDGGAQDAESQDAESQDAESEDAESQDAESQDAASEEPGDAPVDSSAGEDADEAGGMDAADASQHDAPSDVTTHDAPSDVTTHDAPSEGGGTLAPCTSANPTRCVQCEGNSSHLCSPTEALFVAHDIAKGLATAPGPDPAGGCYSCLYNAACIDDTTFGDTGHECEDTGLTTGTAAECRSVISCVLGSTPPCAQSNVSTCYCGTSTTCSSSPSNANGACDTQIAQGLGFAVTDGANISAHLLDQDHAAGRADQIFECAGAQTVPCTACLQ
jgi:hypothetical protein